MMRDETMKYGDCKQEMQSIGTDNLASNTVAVGCSPVLVGSNDSVRLHRADLADSQFTHERPSFRPLTILMTTDTVGGVLVYTLTLARALRAYNITVVLAAMGGPLDPWSRACVKDLDNVYCHESDYKLEWMQDPWTDVKLAGQWLLRLADQVRPDIVHLNNYVHAALNWPCPSLLVGHSCVYSWYRDVRRQAPPVSWKKYYCGVATGLRRADLVTAPTWSFLRTLRELYGPFRSAGAVCNGMDPETCPCPKEPLIFTAGRIWDEGKNIDILKKVQPLVSAPIYVAGNIRHPDGSLADCAALRTLGFLDRRHMADWYARAAVYVLPALYEPFGLSALEAAHAGCALVLGDIPSLREIWANAAVFVDPRDEKAIAAAMNRLLAERALRQEYARRAVGRARLYSISKMAQRYYNFYRILVTNQPIYSPLMTAALF
ncbi:MAG: glycosyltransferase family 4 protein [Planctomycetaceae bacterium]|nr:glycosyltransferase family 4 protein [Planctomycetaceae bacterium]